MVALINYPSYLFLRLALLLFHYTLTPVSPQPKSIDAGISIQTEVACAHITGTTASVV